MLSWEFLKYEMRQFSMTYSKEKAFEKKSARLTLRLMSWRSEKGSIQTRHYLINAINPKMNHKICIFTSLKELYHVRR